MKNIKSKIIISILSIIVLVPFISLGQELGVPPSNSISSFGNSINIDSPNNIPASPAPTPKTNFSDLSSPINTGKSNSIDISGSPVQFGLGGLSQNSPEQGGPVANSVKEASLSGFSLVPVCSGVNGQCGWNDLIVLVKNIMYYLIFIGTTLAAISVSYAGFMYATSAGNAGKIEKAHQVFSTVAVGLIFLWGGWLLIATIMKTLGVQDSFSLLNSSSVVPVVKTK